MTLTYKSSFSPCEILCGYMYNYLIKKEYGKSNLNMDKKANIMSQLVLDFEILKVTADSLPSVLISCIIYKISHDLQTNIKVMTHQIWGYNFLQVKCC